MMQELLFFRASFFDLKPGLERDASNIQMRAEAEPQTLSFAV